MRFRCLILNDAVAKCAHRPHFVSAKLKFRIASATCGPLWAFGFQKSAPLLCVALGLLNNLITVFNSFSISIYIYVYLYEYLLILLLMLISMIIHILVGIYTYMHTYIHIHIHIHLYIHTHICIDNCPPSSGRHAM